MWAGMDRENKLLLRALQWCLMFAKFQAPTSEVKFCCTVRAPALPTETSSHCPWPVQPSPSPCPLAACHNAGATPVWLPAPLPPLHPRILKSQPWLVSPPHDPSSGLPTSSPLFFPLGTSPVQRPTCIPWRKAEVLVWMWWRRQQCQTLCSVSLCITVLDDLLGNLLHCAGVLLLSRPSFLCFALLSSKHELLVSIFIACAAPCAPAEL